MFPTEKTIPHLVNIFKLSVEQVHYKMAEIGLGQATIVPYRYGLIDYLPWTYAFGFEVQSRRHEAVVSFDALTFPFGKYVWVCTISFTIAVFTCLVFIQQCWTYASGEKPKGGWMFQGKITVNLIYID